MMTALAQGLSRLTGTNVDAETLKVIFIFCGIGLLFSLVAIEAFGLDLSISAFL